MKPILVILKQLFCDHCWHKKFAGFVISEECKTKDKVVYRSMVECCKCGKQSPGMIPDY